MKKAVIILLSLFILMSIFCACSAKNTATADEAITTTASSAPLTPESAIRLYLDNASVWEASAGEAFFYLFIDLDFDGNLELVQSVKENNSDKSTNRYFRIDAESNSVVEIVCSDEDAVNRWDFTGGSYPQLYKNNSTGKLKYMVYDDSREAVETGAIRIGEMTYNPDSGIKTRSLWGFRYSALNESPNGAFSYVYTLYSEDGDEKEVTSEEYTDTLSVYEENNTNLQVTIKYIEHTSSEYVYSDLTEQEKESVLLEAYNAFDYSE